MGRTESPLHSAALLQGAFLPASASEGRRLTTCRLVAIILTSTPDTSAGPSTLHTGGYLMSTLTNFTKSTILPRTTSFEASNCCAQGASHARL